MDERPSRVGAADTGLVSRRTVNLGAAWSVPVVLAAVAAPAAQGSQTPTDQRSASFGTITAKKGIAVDGNRQVIFTLIFTNVVGTNTVQIVNIDTGGPWNPMPSNTVTITPTSTSATFTLLRPDNNAALLGVKVTYLLNNQTFTTTVDIKNT